MGYLFLIVVIIVVIVCYITQNKQENIPQKPIIHEIQRTTTINEMITSINYGRVHPFYMGMSLAEVKGLVKFSYVGRLKFDLEKELQHYNIIPLISLRNSLNPHIDNIILSFNENNVINSITIVIKDFEENGTQLKELMSAKFGAHTPPDGRYIAWSDMRMIIRIDEIDGCVDVLYNKFEL